MVKTSRALVIRGAILGAWTGCVVSGAYAGLLIAAMVALMFFSAIGSAPSHPEDAAVQLLITPAIAGFMFICAGLIGVLPGTGLGLLLGLLISLPLALFRQHLTSRGAAAVGVVISAGVVLIIHGLLLRSDPNPIISEYLLMTILPGLLCIGAGGWVGWQLYRL